MDYRTILVHVDDSPRGAERVAMAAAIAAQCQAHLIGVAPTGVSRHLYPSLPTAVNDPTLALHLGFMREQAEQALAGFTLQCEQAKLPSFDARVIDDEAGGGICLHGRTADLIVLTQADPAGGLPLLADLPAHVVLHAGRPVLLLPHAAAQGAQAAAVAPGRVLVSWDASREAARALQLALPLLQHASQVDIAVFNTGVEAMTEVKTADPIPYLARHGIDATMTFHPLEAKGLGHRRHNVGEALLSVAAGSGAQLLVMGAYGHSRMRETILGGVTRTVFEAMNLPVLMAH